MTDDCEIETDRERQIARRAWNQGYAAAVRDAVPTSPTRDPGNPYRGNAK